MDFSGGAAGVTRSMTIVWPRAGDTRCSCSVAIRSIRRAATNRPTPGPIWIQVNVAGEAQKHGAAVADTEALVRATTACPELALRGLMTIAPLADDPESVRPVFRQLRQLSERLHAAGTLPSAARGLSMGMSSDFEVAIEEGATLVRIGSALFREEAAC